MVGSIDDLVQRLGVATSWTDAWGNSQVVSEDNVLAVAGALLGQPLDSESAIKYAVRAWDASSSAIPPVIVCWDGEWTRLEDLGDAEIVCEDGTSVAVPAGETPNRLPIGYHELIVSGRRVASVLSAPRRAASIPEEVSGVIAPTYSLRSDFDTGIGTLRELRQLAGLLERKRIEVVGTLPLLACFPDDPSPYAPASRRAWNEAFLDRTAVPEGIPIPDTVLSGESRVSYGEVGKATSEWLKQAADHVVQTPALLREVEGFAKTHPDTRRYAEFRATVDRLGRDWRRWPADAGGDPADVLGHLAGQWLMDQQIRSLDSDLAGRGQRLYLDLPIGCHPDGYDIWAAPDLFSTASLGAPPDTLFVGGQDWGLPAPIPSVGQADGHRQFRDAVRHQLAVCGLLRIDHVLGLHRTWWVPRGLGANEGAYVAQPTDELFAIVCIESHRAGTPVIGENLGTVPPAIDERLAVHGLAGMVVTADGTEMPGTNDLVAVSSHDTPTIAGWIAHSDIDDMVELGVFDAERAAAEHADRTGAVSALGDRFGSPEPRAIVDGLSAWMAASDAAVALASLDDLLLEERRQNVPGTYKERPNWTLRHGSTIDSLASDSEVSRSLDAVSRRRTLG